ncbi:MAG: biotin/lipoyl-containing protein [candidate division Zixibacteria bacterium]|nr:biotin/lipoyl-containing protein [candidate division Zixibacteria bacterium]
MKNEFLIRGELVSTEFEREGDTIVSTIADSRVTITPSGNGLFICLIDGQRKSAAVALNRGIFLVEIDSVVYELHDPSDDSNGAAASDHIVEKNKIFAPMPGKIVKILVSVGNDVVEKQPMVIVEAMKMENQVNAKASGKVKAIHFKEGDQVDTERPIIELTLE